VAEENIEFYRHLFDETLFLVPDQQVRDQRQAAAAAAALPEEPVSGDTGAGPGYQLLGENRKGLVIAVSLSEKDFQALPRNEFLTKVLSAIQRSPADVAFVNIKRGEKLRIFDLAKETQLNHLVAFGPGLLDMTADSKISVYKPASIGQVPLLIADPLETIELDATKKRLLWNGLQAIFLK
jgi:hypothetical protein